MALTPHERFHLEAVLADTLRHSGANVPKAVVRKLAQAKAVKVGQWEKYLDYVSDAATALLEADEFPVDVIDPSDIHDHLEYDTPFSGGTING